MRISEAVYAVFSEADGSAPLVRALPRLLGASPEWLDPVADLWNVAPLFRRTHQKKFILDLGRMANPELRDLARVYLLVQIVEKAVGPASLRGSLVGFQALDTTIQRRSVCTLRTEDFYAAEVSLREQYGAATHAKACSDLRKISRWLSRNTSLSLDYSPTDRRSALHGRGGTDEQRQAKLLPDEVLADLLAARHRSDLSDRDRFYLCIVAIAVATGFRLMELLTLPADCLVHDQGALLIRSFVSKNGKSAPRAVQPEFEEMVSESISYILKVTEPARSRARELTSDPDTDWNAVVRAESSWPIEYFLRRWLAAWIDRYENRLVDEQWAFYSRGAKSRWIPIVDLQDKHQGNVSAISRELGISRASVYQLTQQVAAAKRNEVYFGSKKQVSGRSFDTDVRFPSVQAFSAHIGVVLTNSKKLPLVSSILEEARAAQISRTYFQFPDRDGELEREYQKKSDVLRNPITGRAVLDLRDALFVLLKNQLSESHAQDGSVVNPLTSSQFNHWVGGYTRDQGTGKASDAVCVRLDIRDPRTGQPAVFTNHDFRHWLETAYENGGLSQTQIATLFNRRSETSNSTYDQTSVAVRRARLQDALADGLLVGHAAQAFERIAEENPEEAVAFLETATKFYNPMPHGICRLNWALEPCPHHLSCFDCGETKDGDVSPCEYLMVDLGSSDQMRAIERINRSARVMKEYMEDEGASGSPQHESSRRVALSTESLLRRAGR